MTHENCVEVLGAKIITTEQKITEWPAASTDKLIRELKLIKILPCSAEVHEHLISMKIMPQ